MSFFSLGVLAALLSVIPYIDSASSCVPALLIARFRTQSHGYVVGVGVPLTAAVKALYRHFVWRDE